MRGIVVASAMADPPAHEGWTPRHPAVAPVLNRPLLLHAIETLRTAGARSIAVVADADQSPRLRSALEGRRAGRLEWIVCPRSDLLSEALLAAEDFVGRRRCIVHDATGLWIRRRSALTRAVAATKDDTLLFIRPEAFRRVSAHVPVVPGGYDALGGNVEAGNVLGGVHVLGAAMFDALHEVSDGERNAFIGAIELLVAGGARVTTSLADGWCGYTGRAEELLALNRAALDEQDHYEGEPAHAGSSIEGRVGIDPSARLHGAVIRGPALIGADATVSDAYVGPYTVLGDASNVENVEIESSIVLTGASVKSVPMRIADSVIGQAAHVGGGFELPRALRLCIGDDARVDLT